MYCSILLFIGVGLVLELPLFSAVRGSYLNRERNLGRARYLFCCRAEPNEQS